MPMPENPAPTMTTLCSWLTGWRRRRSTTTSASSSPQSSWRKWPPPTIVVWGCPLAPAIRSLRLRSAPLVMGSLSLKAHRKGRSKAARPTQAATLASWAGSSGRDGTSSGNCAGPRLVGLVGERRVVGRLDLGRHGLGAPAADDAAGREHVDLLGELLPGEEGVAGIGVARRQEGVGRDDPGEALGVLADQAQADEPAPVLADQRDVRAGRAGRRAARASTRRDGRRCSRCARLGLSDRPKPTRSGATICSPAPVRTGIILR